MKKIDQLIEPKGKKKGTFFSVKNEDLFFQPRLEVGPVDDVYEREADAVADQVVGGQSLAGQPSISSLSVQRKCSKCEEEHVQRKCDNEKESGDAIVDVASVIDKPGKPLEDGAKSFMEERFGYDFSQVKIHTDNAAAKSAQSINALAYTSGNNVVFNEGQYNPGTGSGNRLLAHELTHVVQQNTGKVRAKRIQRECLTSKPGTDEQPFTFKKGKKKMAAEFSDAKGADSFIKKHSGENLVCHKITKGGETVFKVFQKIKGGASTSTTPTPSTTVQDEIFTDKEVERMKSFFIHNASDGSELECINTVRSGIGSLIFDDADLTDGTCPSSLKMTKRNTMEESMAQLVKKSMASEVDTIRFKDSKGKVIKEKGSGKEPMDLESSVWSAITKSIGSATGWSVFGLSLGDGTHSVTLTVDHRTKDIVMFWSDQTSHHAVLKADQIKGISGSQFGWERMLETGSDKPGSTPRGLDAYIRYAIRSFWGLTADEARGSTALTDAERKVHKDDDGKDGPLGLCQPVVRIWRISRP
jgi:hypothetical protein